MTRPPPAPSEEGLAEAEFRPPKSALARALASGLAGLGVVVVAAVAVSRFDMEGDSVETLLTQAAWGPLAAGMMVMTTAFVCMGFRWRALMPAGTKASPMGLTAMVCAGLLLNYAVPGPMGELGAAWFAHRRYKLPMSDSLASGVAARVIGLATASGIALIVWLAVDLPVPESYDNVVAVAAALTGFGGVALSWLAAKPEWWKRTARQLLKPFRGTGRVGQITDKIDRGVSSLADALGRVATRGWRAYATAAGWACLGHVTVVTGIWVVSGSLGVQPDPAGMVFTYCLTTAGAVALFALPGSQVGWDAMFGVLLVGTAGLEPGPAVALALVVRLQQLSVLLLGAVALGYLLRQPTAGPAAPASATIDP